MEGDKPPCKQKIWKRKYSVNKIIIPSWTWHYQLFNLYINSIYKLQSCAVREQQVSPSFIVIIQVVQEKTIFPIYLNWTFKALLVNQTLTLRSYYFKSSAICRRMWIQQSILNHVREFKHCYPVGRYLNPEYSKTTGPVVFFFFFFFFCADGPAFLYLAIRYSLWTIFNHFVTLNLLC